MKKRLYLICLVVTLAACQKTDDQVYQVDPELNEYAQRFISYASQYGKNFSETSMILRFADLTDDKAGVCYMNRVPICMEFDRKNWATYSGANADMQKEYLVFHEMGHGLLRRRHENTVLANGDWKSVMCGDELPNNREPAINYRGIRHQYYLDELFTETNNKPSWSQLTESDAAGSEPYRLHADKTTSNFWAIVDNTRFKSYFDNDQYVFENKQSLPYFIPFNVQFSDQDDFYFELSMSNTSTNNLFGIACGNPSGSPMVLHYLKISKQQHTYIGENTCVYPFIDLYTPLNTDNFNVLAIRKKDNYLYFFLNGKYIYSNDINDLPWDFNSIGFLTPAQTTTRIQYVEIKAFKKLDNALVRSASDAQAIAIYPLWQPTYHFWSK